LSSLLTSTSGIFGLGVGNGILNPEQMEALWAYVIAGEAGN